MISNRYIRTADVDDVEALQTDIMRFMAILGFCLMVIFAMVQSLPDVTIKNEPDLISKELLEHQIAELEKQAQDVLKKLEVVKQSLTDKKDEVSKIASSLLATQESLNKTKKVLKEELIDLSVARQNINHQQRNVDKLKSQTERLEAIKEEQVAKLSSTLNDKKPQKKKKEKSTAQSPIKKQTAENSEKSKKGLSLRFESGKALLSLLKRQKIKFYLVKNKQYFRVSESGSVKLEPMNGQFYQMATYTVPSEFKSRIKRHFTLTKNAKFGITLPKDMEQLLYSFVNKYKHGELVIDSDGKVNYQK
jgi:small-conductance mechanosensitive channel